MTKVYVVLRDLSLWGMPTELIGVYTTRELAEQNRPNIDECTIIEAFVRGE